MRRKAFLKRFENMGTAAVAAAVPILRSPFGVASASPNARARCSFSDCGAVGVEQNALTLYTLNEYTDLPYSYLAPIGIAIRMAQSVPAVPNPRASPRPGGTIN